LSMNHSAVNCLMREALRNMPIANHFRQAILIPFCAGCILRFGAYRR